MNTVHSASDLPQQTVVSTSSSKSISLEKLDWSSLPFRSHPEVMRIWGLRTHADGLAADIAEDGGILHSFRCAALAGDNGKPILFDGYTRLLVWFTRKQQGIVEPLPKHDTVPFANISAVLTKVVDLQARRRNVTAMQIADARISAAENEGYEVTARSQGRPKTSDEKRTDTVKRLPGAKVLARKWGVSDFVIRAALKTRSDKKFAAIRKRSLLPVADEKYLSPIQAVRQVDAFHRDEVAHTKAKVAAKRRKIAMKMEVVAADVIRPDGIYVTDAVEGMKKIEGESVDLILSSPPYANEMEYDMGNPWDGDYEKYLDTFVRQPLIEAKRVLKYGGRVVLNFDNTYRSKEKKAAGDKREQVPNIYNCWKDFSKIAEDELGFLPMAYHIWYKQNCPNYFAHGSRDFRQPVYNPNTEFVMVWAKDSMRHPSASGESDITEREYNTFSLSHWYIAPQPRKKTDDPHYHPCPFSEELAYRAIKLYSPKHGVVLDHFNGSGTTTFVAAALGREYIGLDLSPLSVTSAKKRVASLDGMTATQKIKQITRFLPEDGERSDGQRRHRARKNA